MDNDTLKGCLDVVNVDGGNIVNDSREAFRARRRFEDQQQAVRDEAYSEANEDRAILTFDHWLDNVYYSGEFVPPNTWPVIRRIANEVFERGVYELILRGAIGFGKSTLTRLIQKYCAYYLTTFASPHKAFTRKLVETDPIVMINMNVTAEKAKSAYFDSFRRSITGTAYFQDKCVLKKGLINRIEFMDKAILCHFAGASKHAAESENLIFAGLDEINLYENVERSKRSDSGDRYDEAAVVDAAVTHRQETRFINPDGSFPLPVKKVLLSKETYPDSYIARRSNEIKEKELDKVDGNGNQYAMIVHLAEWESKPRHYYIDKTQPAKEQWFWIRTGTRNMPAKIVTDKRRAHEERKRIQLLKDEGADADLIPELIKVPLMGGKYLAKAEANIEDFIRDVCGRPTEAIDMYLKDRTLLTVAKELRIPGKPWPWFRLHKRHAKPGDLIPQSVGVHPFTEEATNLQDGVVLLRDRLVHAFKETGIAGEQYVRHAPIVAPSAPRFIHLDMGLSHDAAGLAMVAVPGMKDVTRWDDEKDASMPVQAPWVWLDFAIRFVPPPEGQIRFSGIKSLVRELVRLGFRIVASSADGYMSADWLQWCAEQYDMDTEVLSLDRTPDGYNALSRTLAEHRLVMYEHSWLEGEIRALERKMTKRSVGGKTIRFEFIDHTPRQTKDLSDGLAGSVWNATRKATEYTQHLSVPVPLQAEVKTQAQVVHEKERGIRDAMRKGDLERVFDITGGYNDGNGGGGW